MSSSLSMKRKVALPPIEAGASADAPAAAGGAIRSARLSARSARLKSKSPYVKSPSKPPPAFSPSKYVPAGPPTTGLSAELEGMAVGSVTRARARAMVDNSFGVAAIERQKQKEEKWKARLTKEKSTWWDAAALGAKVTAQDVEKPFQGSRVVIDRALRRTATATDESLLTLALGRNHAKHDVREVAEWKDAAMDAFLGTKPPPPPKFRDTPSSSSSAPLSPGHLDRKYGRARGALPPISVSTNLERKARLTQAASAAELRSRQTAAAREAVFKPASR